MNVCSFDRFESKIVSQLILLLPKSFRTDIWLIDSHYTSNTIAETYFRLIFIYVVYFYQLVYATGALT